MNAAYVFSGAALMVSIGTAAFNHRHTERRFRAASFPVVSTDVAVYCRPGYVLGATTFTVGFVNQSENGMLIRPHVSVAFRRNEHRMFPRSANYKFHAEEMENIFPLRSGRVDFPDQNNALGEFDRFLMERFPDVVQKVMLPGQEQNESVSHSYQFTERLRLVMRVSLDFRPNIHGEENQLLSWDFALSPVLETIEGIPCVLRRWKFDQTGEGSASAR